MKRSALFGWCALMLVLVASCARQDTGTTDTPAASDAIPDATAAPAAAVATVAATEGHQVTGTVTFVQEADGVRVTANLSGLTPGDHGMHVHETGDCSAPDAISAGDHYNPTAMPHGGPDSGQRHVGDLGNVTADANGNAQMDRVVTGLTLQGDHTILGRAVVVHASMDDLTSQPAGNSGARIGCGVITAQ